MIDVIGVSFKNAGKVYYFTPGDLPVKRGLHVIVETARGMEYGTAVGEIKQIDEEQFQAPVKPILRIATKRDDEQEFANREKEKKAFDICKEKIAARGLDMKLIGAEYTFDNSKVLFYFTADGRVDFRELVKDLAGVFRTRIELRQIGVRDETKIMGGIGICGRPLCCHIYLSDFAPVSIKMAKEQNLSLNPTKISGTCGRLMCCLKNEEDTYEYLNKLMPGVGDMVTAEDGTVEGEVHSVNVLRQTVKILVEVGEDDREIKEYKVDELTFEPRKGNYNGKRDRKRKRQQDNKQDADSPQLLDPEIEEELLEEGLEDDSIKELEELEELEKLEESGREETVIEAEGSDIKADRRRNDRSGQRHKNFKKDHQKNRSDRGDRPEKQDRAERPDRPDRNERGKNKGPGRNQDRNQERSRERVNVRVQDRGQDRGRYHGANRNRNENRHDNKGNE